jgi:hypothetical protein
MVADQTFFSTLRILPIRGRLIGAADRAGAEAVAVVSAAAERQLWPGQNAVGQMLAIGDSLPELVRVVGVVPDAKVLNARLKEAAPPIIYRPFDQAPTPYPTFIVRSPGTMAEIVRRLRTTVERLTQSPPVPSSVVSIEELESRELAAERVYTSSMAAFAGLAVLLAAMGVYGIAAFTATQRASEFGIRAALGATPTDIFRLVAMGAIKLTVLGLAAGGLVSFAGLRVLERALAVPSSEGASLAAATLLLLPVLLFSLFGPAWKAARAAPTASLRN